MIIPQYGGYNLPKIVKIPQKAILTCFFFCSNDVCVFSQKKIVAFRKKKNKSPRLMLMCGTNLGSTASAP